MQIKEMFKKSITRDIQGVVIAGQGEKNNIATELGRIRRDAGAAAAFCRFLLCIR